MKNETKKKGSLKDGNLSIRIDEMAKKKIVKKAKKLGVSTSDYVRECCLVGKGQRAEQQQISELAIICQEICNYVEDKYKGDRILEEWTETIWRNIL